MVGGCGRGELCAVGVHLAQLAQLYQDEWLVVHLPCMDHNMSPNLGDMPKYGPWTLIWAGSPHSLWEAAKACKKPMKAVGFNLRSFGTVGRHSSHARRGLRRPVAEAGADRKAESVTAAAAKAIARWLAVWPRVSPIERRALHVQVGRLVVASHHA